MKSWKGLQPMLRRFKKNSVYITGKSFSVQEIWVLQELKHTISNYGCLTGINFLRFLHVRIVKTFRQGELISVSGVNPSPNPNMFIP